MIINFKKKMSRQEEKLYLDLVQKTQEQLYKMAFTYVHNKEDALDIVQDTIYKGYISYHKLKDRRYEKTWLIRILINTSLDFIKKQKGLVLLDENIVDESNKMETSTHNKMVLEQGLKVLNHQEKSVIMMRYFEDLKLKDIALILKLPISTVKSTLYRALKKMEMEIMEV